MNANEERILSDRIKLVEEYIGQVQVLLTPLGKIKRGYCATKYAPMRAIDDIYCFDYTIGRPDGFFGWGTKALVHFYALVSCYVGTRESHLEIYQASQVLPLIAALTDKFKKDFVRLFGVELRIIERS